MDRTAALALWKDVVTATVRAEGPDLSARQTAILLRIYMEPAPHTVRGLAEALRLGKPAVTRALDMLEGLDLVKRKRDEADMRNVLVQRTGPGTMYLSEFADLILSCAAANDAPSRKRDAA